MIKTATIKGFEYMTLYELNLLHNKQLTRRYDSILEGYETDRIAKKVIQTLYGAPICEIVCAIEESEMDHKSEFLFPGSQIVIYPGIREAKALKEYTCDFSGSRISIGSIYANYRPMLKNINNGDTYILKRTLRVETSYEYCLPTNIGELEALNDKIMNHQFIDYDDDIQYDHLYIQTGGGLTFKKLNRRKYENRNS